MTSFGVHFRDRDTRDREILNAIIEPLGDDDHRTPRIRELAAMGLAAERAMAEFDVVITNGSERDAFVEQAVRRTARRRAEEQQTDDADDGDGDGELDDELRRIAAGEYFVGTRTPRGETDHPPNRPDVDVDREFAQRLSGGCR